MKEHQASFEVNRRSWDERVESHWASAMYRRHADALRAGGHTLPTEIVRGVGDVAGKRLLHLQCHMGMETMMWSRLGATAVGVDFSELAIGKANQLRDELRLDTRFYCANVYDTPSVVEGVFDVVFVSIGSLCWLPDISRWAQVVSQMLAPGGILYLNDGHPMFSAIDDTDAEPGFGLCYPYLGGDRLAFDEDGSYADAEASFTHNKFEEWIHPLGQIVTSVIEAGMQLCRLDESARCGWPALKVMRQVDEQSWVFPEPWNGKLPVDFTLIANKPKH